MTSPCESRRRSLYNVNCIENFAQFRCLNQKGVGVLMDVSERRAFVRLVGVRTVIQFPYPKQVRRVGAL